MENKIGPLLKRLREEREISQETLAAAVHCDQTAISKIETGRRAVTDIEQIERFANFFEMPLAEFLEAAGISDELRREATSPPVDHELHAGKHNASEVINRLLSGQGSNDDQKTMQRDLLQGRVSLAESDETVSALEAPHVVFTADHNRVILRLAQQSSEQLRDKLFPPPPGLPPPLTSLLFVGRSGDID